MLMYAKEAYKRSGSNALFKLFVQLGLDINAKDYGDRDLFSYLVDDGLNMEELLK